MRLKLFLSSSIKTADVGDLEDKDVDADSDQDEILGGDDSEEGWAHDHDSGKF